MCYTKHEISLVLLQVKVYVACIKTFSYKLTFQVTEIYRIY